MIAPAGMKMGRFAVEVELVNHRDQVPPDAGPLEPGSVRRARIRGIVDNGATRLVLPQSVATELGVPTVGETSVRYADNRSAQRQIVGDVELRYIGRTGIFAAIVEPKGECAYWRDRAGGSRFDCRLHASNAGPARSEGHHFRNRGADGNGRAGVIDD
jgi:hypothetical protein